jgi:transposase
VQRPTMKFVATKTAEQLDLQALHRVRERLVSQRTGIINQIRSFMLERGIAVRQGIGFLRTELPTVLATRSDALSPRMLRVIEELAGDWRRLDQRIDGLTGEIEALARQDQACSRLMTVPGIGPIISSAMVAAIGTGEVFSKGRDFGAWLGLVHKQISTGDRTILGKISRRGNRVRPCNLKPQLRDATPVLRRPVEPAPNERTSSDRPDWSDWSVQYQIAEAGRFTRSVIGAAGPHFASRRRRRSRAPAT